MSKSVNKYIMFFALTLVAGSILSVIPQTVAATNSGYTCSDGSYDPFENTPSASIPYETYFTHKYGFCNNGELPSVPSDHTGISCSSSNYSPFEMPPSAGVPYETVTGHKYGFCKPGDSLSFTTTTGSTGTAPIEDPIGTGSTGTSPTLGESSCGGVETSIIQCKKTGSCPVINGVVTNPYEGADPGKDVEKNKTYVTNYGHAYGLCADGSTPSLSVKDSGIWGILLLLINIMTAGIGIVAVGGLIYGSILYASAGGSPENTKKAKTIITDIVIGLVAYALMYAFLNFIIPGGLFS